MADITLQNAAQKFRDVVRLLAELNEVALSAMETGADTTNIRIDLHEALSVRQILQNWILEHMPEFFE
jgi:hypothetical protein